MSDRVPSSRFPAWFAPAVVVMMAMQLVLAWLQGGLLHRQHQELQALREDVQDLADTLAEGSDDQDEGAAEPARRIHPLRRPGLQRIRLRQAQPAPSEEDPARKELEESAASAQKAVSDARKVQSQLSIAENIRKADEQARLDAAQNAWIKWAWLGTGIGALAIGVAAWWRRRG
jgi:hypothetical protein